MSSHNVQKLQHGVPLEYLKDDTDDKKKRDPSGRHTKAPHYDLRRSANPLADILVVSTYSHNILPRCSRCHVLGMGKDDKVFTFGDGSISSRLGRSSQLPGR